MFIDYDYDNGGDHQKFRSSSVFESSRLFSFMLFRGRLREEKYYKTKEVAQKLKHSDVDDDNHGEGEHENFMSEIIIENFI